MRTWLTVIALVLCLGACGDESGDAGGGDDGGGEDGPVAGRSGAPTKAGFPCNAIPDAVLSDIDDDLQRAGFESRPARTGVGLLEGNEHVVACTLVPEFLYAGVLGYDQQAPLDFYLDVDSRGAVPEPVTGLGDEALVAPNSFDGQRLVARQGDRVVVVDSRFSGDTLSQERLVELAHGLLDSDADLPPVDLPEDCPPVDDEHLTAELDEVVLARGRLRQDGSLTCDYASDDGQVRLFAVNADETFLTMMQADETGPPVDLDGDPAYVDDDRVSVVVGDRCLIGALTSPMGWALADPRSDEELSDVLLDLARWVRDDIGCPD